MAQEQLLTIQAKDYINVAGVTYKQGDIFMAPASDALALVGMGLAEEISQPAGIFGAPVLSYSLPVDATMGSFSQSVQFPPDSMLLFVATLTYTGFSGGSADTEVQLGSASDRNDILPADGFGPQHQTKLRPVSGSLPFAVDPDPFELWITVIANGNTSGKGVITLVYAHAG